MTFLHYLHCGTRFAGSQLEERDSVTDRVNFQAQVIPFLKDKIKFLNMNKFHDLQGDFNLE